MADTRTHLQAHDLAGIARAAFGPSRTLAGVDRLHGGSKKGVYRLVLDDGSTGIAYVWHADENYWPDTGGGDPADPFAAADGIDLFVSAHQHLTNAGVRVPALRVLDRDLGMAVLEDLRGGTLEDLESSGRQAVLERFAATVRNMHAHRAEWYGRAGTPVMDHALRDRVLERALRHLAESAARVEEIAAVAGRVHDDLRRRYSAIRPRDGYTLIHGELGPDHVLIDAAGNPVIIDIEGVMYLDVEWEHVFLELRFGDDYRYLVVDDLDPDRLSLYRLAMYLSLVAGPLRLLDGDFPHRSTMRAIADANIRNVLRELGAPGATPSPDRP